MRIAEKTKEQLIEELEALRLRTAELEKLEAERKQAEEELLKRVKIIDSISDAVITTDLSGNITSFNTGAELMYGYKAQEVIGKPVSMFYLVEDVSLMESQISGIVKGNSISGIEARIIGKNKKEVSVILSLAPVRDSEGKVIGLAGIAKDSTERKGVEEALQAEKNKLQSVIDAMEDGLTIQDKDYNIIYQNKLVRKLFGDHLGEKCYRVYEGKEKLCDGCPVEKAFRDGKSHTSERRVVLPSGEVTFWENTANPIRDAEGKIVSCLEINRNITERKQVQEKIRQQNEFLNNILDSLSHPFYVLDVNDYTIKMANLAAKLGNLVENQTCYSLTHKKAKPCGGADHVCPLEEVKKTKKPIVVEHIHYDEDGNARNIEVHGYPIFDTEGNVVQMIEYCLDITERKQAEQALADEATRRRILIEQSLDGIVVLDEDAKVYEANKRFAEMLGYTPEEVRELHTWDWDKNFPPEQLLEMGRNVDEAGLHLETQHHRKDGSVIDVDISINGAMCAGQKLIFCVCRDITERKQAEDTVKEAEEKYKNLVEATSDLVWESNEKGTFTFVSPKIKDILGYEVDEVAGKKRTLDFTPEEEKRKWISRFKEVNAKKEPFFGFEITHIHKNGSPVVFEVSGAPFFDNAGNFKGYVGINKDVTERKQAEEALRESQEFSFSLLENSPNPVFVVNPDTSVKYVNPAFEKLTSFTLAEITGRKAPYPWWLKEQWKETTASFKNAMVTGGRRSEKVFQKKNGERFFVAINSAPIVHEGKLLYFLINWLDITERKRAEEEKGELEQKAHLASRLASVGEMASGIAHEINNPLTAVIGFAQLLMDTDLPDEVKEDVGVIHKEAQRAAGVARNLLTFARKHTLGKQPTNLNSIVEGVLKLRAYEQSVSNIRVNTRLALDLPEVMADYSQMQQVFINIILNAETAMLEAGNGGTLTVTTQKVNNTVRASFADSGPGIAKENLNRIFDPFFTTKGVGKGTGLGLSVCHGIVAEHGGRIYARSRLGSGATFIVELPINAH